MTLEKQCQMSQKTDDFETQKMVDFQTSFSSSFSFLACCHLPALLYRAKSVLSHRVKTGKIVDTAMRVHQRSVLEKQARGDLVAMHFQELLLFTSSLANQKRFYCKILGLSLTAETGDSFTVQAGTTCLCFREIQLPTLYHLAFTIPRNTFGQAKDWLKQRVPLLQRKSEDEIFFANINARSFYFCDAGNNILEYIVHYDLDQETEGGFGSADILHVSEIGLPVEDVVAQASVLQETFALQPYGGPISEDFAFLGDIYGQLVLVKIGRPWLPTQTVLAAPAAVRLTISGQRKEALHLWPHPYTLAVLPS